jgi:Uma2 family endonuclease
MGANLTAMSAANPPALVTLDAWGDLDEDDSRELVNGRLEEEEVPSAIHEAVVRWLVVVLDAYFDPRGGHVFGSGLKLAVRPLSGRLADVACYAPGKRPEPRGLVRTPPDIVVEVVSPSPRDERRDRIEKPDDYGAFGVRYYWLVDPELRSFEIWELGNDGRYARAASAIAGKIDPVPGCNGLLVDVDALWAKLGELEGD